MRMENLVGWKLYYADGNIVDSTKMKFDDAPEGGVQVLLKWYEVNNKYSVEIEDSLHTYMLYSNMKKAKIGHNIRKEKFEELLNIAKADKVPVISMEV